IEEAVEGEIEEEIELVTSNIKASVESVLLEERFNDIKNHQDELIDIVKKNSTVDWIMFESKKAKMRLVIKNYFRTKHVSNEQIEVLTDLIIEKLIENFPKEAMVE
ncbi:type I restriction enzyme endonuclease domain-containing protein, partial [Bacillus pumilus]